jgi:hypothetical protein
MNLFIKPIAFLIIAAINISAQIQYNITVTNNFSVNAVEIFKLNFGNNHYKVNNHDVYYSLCRDVEDSISADTLVFLFINAKNILIRGISFSRNGRTYCSADSFPARDSLKWKVSGGTQSLVFADSLLYFSSKNGGSCFWILEQKCTFHPGDTFKLLLDKPPEPYTQVAPHFLVPAKQPNRPQGDKFMLINDKSKLLSFQEPINRQVFDLNGKKHSISPGVAALYIIPSSKGNKTE